MLEQEASSASSGPLSTTVISVVVAAVVAVLVCVCAFWRYRRGKGHFAGEASQSNTLGHPSSHLRFTRSRTSTNPEAVDPHFDDPQAEAHDAHGETEVGLVTRVARTSTNPLSMRALAAKYEEQGYAETPNEEFDDDGALKHWVHYTTGERVGLSPPRTHY